MKLKVKEARIKLGLCPYCGGEVDTDGKMCSKCRRKNSEQQKERRQYYLSNGICPYCGREKLFGDERSCPECRAKRANVNERCVQKNKEHYKRLLQKSEKILYYKRKEQGICTRCGKRNAKIGCLCETCNLQKRKYGAIERAKRGITIPRSERYSYGLCYTCGNKLDTDKRICSVCSERVSKNFKDSRLTAHWKQQNKLIFKN